MPNPLAYAVLFLFPIGIFWMYRRWPPVRAATFSLFGAMMLMPNATSVDLPVIPAFDKQTLPVLAVLVGGILWHRRRFEAASRPSAFIWLALAYLAGNIATALANGDALVYDQTVLRPLTLYEGISYALAHLLVYMLPFFFGRAYVRSIADFREMARTLVGACLAYSILALIEMRFSPQFHNWVYGFHSSGFGHTKRGSMYRPEVFMTNGLAMALLFACVAILATALAVTGVKFRRTSSAVPAGYFTVVLVLTRSAAATIYGLLGLGLVRLVPPRAQVRLAVVIGILVFVYPFGRLMDWVPLESIQEWSAALTSEDRSMSLAFRFDNEDLLLDKVHERPWLGWGKGDRLRIYNERGGNVSTKDGAWITALGEFGAVGYCSLFGLIVGAILFVPGRFRQLGTLEEERCLAALTLVVTFHAVDLIPNGTFTYIPFFYAGALVGLSEGLAGRRTAPRRAARPEQVRGERNEAGGTAITNR